MAEKYHVPEVIARAHGPAQDFLKSRWSLGLECSSMPCPYFMPTRPAAIAGLPHPERLSLGNAYSGHCTAADLAPDEPLLHECNLGYANCAHLPASRVADAVRFSIRRDRNGLFAICYVFESGHAPVGHGVLNYDPAAGAWNERHSDACIQRMAECCVQSLCKES